MNKHTVTGYHLVWVLLVCVTLCGASLAVALRANRGSEEKFCGIVNAVVAGYRETPPQTDSGRNQQSKWEELSRSLHCASEQIRPRVTPSTYGYPTSGK